MAVSGGRMMPRSAPGAPAPRSIAPLLPRRQHRGGTARPNPSSPSLKALLSWRGGASWDDPDRPAERRSLFLDEDDYELTDDEELLETKTPSRRRSSSSSSSGGSGGSGSAASSRTSLALRGGDDDEPGGAGDRGPLLASLASSARSRLGRGARRLRARARRATADLPDDLLGRALWLWESRPVARARLAVSVAAAGARAPALVALIASQAGAVAASTQLSLPVVAPLLIGLPVLARSVAANASAVAPRAAAAALLLWLAWFCNRVATATAVYLRRQGALDARIAGAAVACSEVLALGAAALVLLSALGVNVAALLFPAAALAGWAAADGAKCFGAGAFLFASQPFRLGDRVAVRVPPVSSGASSAGGDAGEEDREEGEERGGGGPPSSWFDGRVEHVDLRYTVVRRGNARMFLPNSSFLTREFVVFDAPERQPEPVSMSSSMAAAARRRRAAAQSQQQRNAGTQTTSRGGGSGAFPPPPSYPLPPYPQPAPQSAGWSNYAPGAWIPQQQQPQALWQQPPPSSSQPPPQPLL